MQPTFLPYVGFFALMDYVDEFVFLDNVQFDKRSWQQRNYLKGVSEKEIINIPVLTKGKFDQKILDVEIDYTNFKINKLINKIKINYKKSKYLDLYINDIEIIFKKKHVKLVNLNSELILKFCEYLNIKTEISFASKLLGDKKLVKIDLLKEISKIKKSNNYISTIGSKDYLKSLKKFPDTEISIKFFSFDDVKYFQLGNNFVPNLSIIDLLFNEGPNSINILRKYFKII